MNAHDVPYWALVRQVREALKSVFAHAEGSDSWVIPDAASLPGTDWILSLSKARDGQSVLATLAPRDA